MKTTCSQGGARGRATLPSCTANLASADIGAVRRWCGPTWATCARPPPMAPRLAHARSEQRPSRHVHYGGFWHASVTISIRSGIPELGSFVAGIERDYDAVHAALRLPWSQGVTEGKVNKLKTLKRVMYGRAGFALLR